MKLIISMARSLMVMKFFFILHVISTHPKAWIIFFFYSLSASIPKHDKIFSDKYQKSFYSRFFKNLRLGLEIETGESTFH